MEAADQGEPWASLSVGGREGGRRRDYTSIHLRRWLPGFRNQRASCPIDDLLLRVWQFNWNELHNAVEHAVLPTLFFFVRYLFKVIFLDAAVLEDFTLRTKGFMSEADV